MHRVAIVALDEALMSGLAAMLDALDLVNRYGERQYADREVLPPLLQVRLVTPAGRPVHLANGRSLSADEALGHAGEPFDLVYAAPFAVGADIELEAVLNLAAPVTAWLARQHQAGALIAASGSAVLLLAEAGLLEGRRVTLPWWLERPFHRRYPHLEVDASQRIYEAEDLLLASSPDAEPALALRLVERLMSPNVANWVAAITMVDPYPDGPPPWTVFSPEVLEEDPLVARAQHWLQLRFSRKPRLRDLADHVAVSERTLVRRFERSLGMTPLAYLQLLRIEAAKQMLSRSDRKVDRVGYLVGYSDAGFFNRLFRQHTGMTPSQYRRCNGSGRDGDGDSAAA